MTDHRAAAADLLDEWRTSDPGPSPGVDLASAATAHALLSLINGLRILAGLDTDTPTTEEDNHDA